MGLLETFMLARIFPICSKLIALLASCFFGFALLPSPNEILTSAPLSVHPRALTILPSAASLSSPSDSLRCAVGTAWYLQDDEGRASRKAGDAKAMQFAIQFVMQGVSGWEGR